MTSQTKARILEQHENNSLLNAPAPPLMARGANDFSSDDIFAPIDERMIASAVEALEAGQTHYVDVPGIAPLRGALADYLRAAYQANYVQTNVIVTAGIQESRFLTLQMIGEVFERVAVPAVAHPGVRKALGVRPLAVDLLDVDAKMLPTLESIRAALEAGNRLLYIESPSRLSGAAYSADAITEIAALVGKFDATAIWDQGLAPWTVAYTSLASASDAASRTLAIGEAFPGTGLSSWFIGYIASPEQHVPSMQSQKQIMAICTSTAAQYAALEASKLFAESHPAQLERLNAARQSLIAALGSSTTVIAGATATVVALRLSLPEKVAALARLAAAGYSAADGADFGAPDVIRLTVSHNTAAHDAIARLVRGA